MAGDWDGDGRDAVGILWRSGTMELPVPVLDDPEATRDVPTGVSASSLPVAGDWNGTDLVTIEELRQIYGPLPDEAKVAEGLPALNAMAKAGIYTPARKAAFLATIRNESGPLRRGGDRQRPALPGAGASSSSPARSTTGPPAGSWASTCWATPTWRRTSWSAVAAWYWTVARTINLAADELDMAAVNIAVGFAPNVRRDMVRCADFIAALRYYSGGVTPRASTAPAPRARGGWPSPPWSRPPGLVPQAPSAPAATVAPDLGAVHVGAARRRLTPPPRARSPPRPPARRRPGPGSDCAAVDTDAARPRHGPARHGPADHGHVHDGHVHDGHDHDGHVHHRRSRRPRPATRPRRWHRTPRRPRRCSRARTIWRLSRTRP